MSKRRLKTTRSEGEPHDRMTRYADEMVAVLRAKGAEAAGVKVVVMLTDAEVAGTVIYGYEDAPENEALVDLFMHLKAIFNSQGKDIVFAPMPGRPENQ